MVESSPAAWRAGYLPLADAVTSADNTMVLLQTETYSDATATVRALARTTLESFLQFNPGWWAAIETLCHHDDAEQGKAFGGEGPHGSDGFIARCDATGELAFAVFLTSSNPFTDVAIDSDRGLIRGRTSLGTEWTVSRQEPWRISTRIRPG